MRFWLAVFGGALVTVLAWRTGVNSFAAAFLGGFVTLVICLRTMINRRTP